MGSIEENAREVLKNVERAAIKSGRTLSDITVIGVTKTQSVSDMERLFDCGITSFGENKVQEFMDKYGEVKRNPHWHLIGHLQTNKVKYIIDKVELIQSVESLSLAEEINKRAQKAGIISNVLIEVNIGDESSKFGIQPETAVQFAKDLEKYSNICLKGLMCVAPFVENSENNRELFRKMRHVFVDIKKEINDNDNISILSMGMTNDYEVAIEEGSNMVRVGTGFFGERNYRTGL